MNTVGLDGVPVRVTEVAEPGEAFVVKLPGIPTTLYVHRLDWYRLLHQEETKGLDNLEVLALWHVDEVDRRLTAAGYPRETVPEKLTITNLDVGTITTTSIRSGRTGWTRER